MPRPTKWGEPLELTDREQALWERLSEDEICVVNNLVSHGWYLTGEDGDTVLFSEDEA